MHRAFELHMLNEVKKLKAGVVAQLFDGLVTKIDEVLKPPCSREYEIMLLKLEEACFYCKKCMASLPENQQK